jgi:hypothetical protein
VPATDSANGGGGGGGDTADGSKAAAKADEVLPLPVAPARSRDATSPATAEDAAGESDDGVQPQHLLSLRSTPVRAASLDGTPCRSPLTLADRDSPGVRASPLPPGGVLLVPSRAATPPRPSPHRSTRSPATAPRSILRNRAEVAAPRTPTPTGTPTPTPTRTLPLPADSQL